MTWGEFLSCLNLSYVCVESAGCGWGWQWKKLSSSVKLWTNWVWWCRPVIPALWRKTQEDQESWRVLAQPELFEPLSKKKGCDMKLRSRPHSFNVWSMPTWSGPVPRMETEWPLWTSLGILTCAVVLTQAKTVANGRALKDCLLTHELTRSRTEISKGWSN